MMRANGAPAPPRAGVRPTSRDVGREELYRAALTYAICLVVAFIILKVISGQVTDDTYTYLTAGERLNAGHQLYALSPGDRPVDLNPPYWTVPLLSPPLIAVLWRPLSALPADLGAVVWLAGAWTCLLMMISAFVQRRRSLTWLTIIAVAFSLFYEFGVGNLNPYIYAAILGSWLLLRERRGFAAGFVLAVAAAVKVTPGVFLIWLAFTFDRRVWLGAVAGLAASLALSLVGAGLGANVEYLSIAASTNSGGTTDLSLAGLARALGVPPNLASPLPVLTILLGVVGLWYWRKLPAAGFRLAVILLVFGSPVVYINTFSALLLLITPWAFPWQATEMAAREAVDGRRPIPAPEIASVPIRDRVLSILGVLPWAVVGMLVWRTFDVRLLASRGEPLFITCGLLAGAGAGFAMYLATADRSVVKLRLRSRA